MTDSKVSHLSRLDPAGLYVNGGVVPGRPTRCPVCGGSDPEAVWDGFRTNFFCHQCGTCTHIGLGFLWTVDPHTCHGCAYRSGCLASSAVSRGDRSGRHDLPHPEPGR